MREGFRLPDMDLFSTALDSALETDRVGATKRDGEMTVHIQDQVTNELMASGWDRPGADFRFTKTMETGGQFGKAICTVIMDEGGRWFEAIDGWGHVVHQIDLRNYDNNPKGAIADLTA